MVGKTRNPERDEQIMVAREAGNTLAQVGEQFGLSPDRVWKIAQRESERTRFRQAYMVKRRKDD